MQGLLHFAPEHQYFSYTTPYHDQRALKWADDMQKLSKPLTIVSPAAPWALAPDLWRRFGIVGDAQRQKIDIFHGLSHELPQFSKNGKPALVVTVHDLIFMRFPQFFPWIDRQVYAWKLKHACAHADLIVAICEQTAKDLEEFLQVSRQKIRVVYQSVGEIFEKPIALEDKNNILQRWQLQEKKYLMMVGAYEARKNQENLIRAVAQLKDIPPLILIGRGDRYQKFLQGLVAEYKLQNRVRFLNDVPFIHLPALYQGALASIYPSHFEGFGLPLVESLIVGTPVVTSKGSCFPEAAGPGAIYIGPNDVDDLALAIEKIVHDDSLRNKLSLSGKEYVQRFQSHATTRHMLEIYQEVTTIRS
jgi:glycosyltransferase involved in cell wall biosynthesis